MNLARLSSQVAPVHLVVALPEQYRPTALERHAVVIILVATTTAIEAAIAVLPTMSLA